MVALSLSIIAFATTQNALAYSRRYISLVAGQSIRIKCYAGQLATRAITQNTEWEVYCNGTQSPSPTPTTVANSPTPTPGGQLSTPTVTPTMGHSGEPDGSTSTARQSWHALGTHDGLNIHEHGDAPPTWATEFATKNFGHGVLYGGDEGTPNENIMKHQAFKGFLMSAANTGGVEVYVRYHAASNPHDRAFPFHSYEIYARDSSGNVSFWQGWNFYGYPELRNQRMTRRHEVPGVDGFPGRDQFIIASPDKTDWDNYLRCEQWYGHGGLWAWDISITICGATTYFSYDEHKGDFSNMATWNKTGSLGGSRRLEISHYGPQNPNVGGSDLPFNKWFCAKLTPNENRSSGQTPTWDLTGAVNDPNSCPSGYLPQFVADTLPKAGVYFKTGNTQEKTFSTTGVTLPN